MPASYDGDGPRPQTQGAGLFTAMRRYWYLVIAAIVVAAALGVAVTYLLPTKYTADAQVVLGDPNDTTVFRTVPILNATAKAQNAAQIMRSQEVYDRASAILDHKVSASDISGSVTITPGALGNPLVTVFATRDSATGARNMANAEGQAYLDVVKSQAADLATRRRKALTQPQNAMQLQLASVNAQSSERAAAIEKQATTVASPADRAKYVQSVLASDPQYLALRNKATQLNTNIAAISQTLQETRVDSSLSQTGVDTLYAASTPTNPQNSNLKRNIVVAAAIGLLIGAALAWRRQDKNRGIDQETVARTLGAPALATIKRDRELADPTRVINLDRGRPLPDDLRVLASSLLLNLRRRSLVGCVITSVEPGVGKTMLTLNLAAAADSAGNDVVLVDGDVRDATLTRGFGMDGAPGLLDILGDSGTEPQFGGHRYAADRTLPILPIGRGHALESSRTQLPELHYSDGSTPVAIVDTPAVSTDPLALLLASGPAGLVVVVSNATSLADLRTLRSRAELAGATILGFVVNEYRPGRRDRQSTPQPAPRPVDGHENSVVPSL